MVLLEPARTTNSAIVAAAKRLDIGDVVVRRMLKRATPEWQNLAWGYYDLVPEVGFAGRYSGNMLSRLRLFPAYVPAPGEEPIRLDPDDPDQQALGLAAIGEAAYGFMDSLAGPTGDTGTLTGPLAVGLTIPGEAYLIGEPASSGGLYEWNVYSNDEIRVDERAVFILSGPEDREGRPLVPNSIFVRIWNRHPRWREQADSSMRTLLDPCEELSLLSQAIRAGATQRLSAGILLIPEGMTFVQKSVAGADATIDPLQDPFLMTIVEAMSLPIQNPDTASAVIPLLMRGPAEKLKEVRHMVIDRPFDDLAMRQRTELRSVLATGLDLPAEIILGLSDANHWTAWAVDEQTYKAHLDPKALTICAALTSTYLHPALRTAGFDPTAQPIIVWRDPSDLIADPDQWPRALDAHKAILISDRSARRYGGFSEEDAPDEEEAQLRAERARPALPGAPAGPPQGRDTEEEGPPEQEEAARLVPLVAAAARLRRGGSLDRLAVGLHGIDRSLRERLQARCDAAVRRALEIAGGKVRRRINGAALQIPDEVLRERRQTLKVALSRIRRHDEICARLGIETIRGLGLEDEDLIDDELDTLAGGREPEDGTLASFYLTATSRAYSEARRLAARELDRGLDPAEVASMEDRERKHIEAGFAVLSAALASTIRTSLFQTKPSEPDRGEFSPDVRVAPGLIRESLAVAGGAPTAAPDPTTGGPSGGVATGEETTGMLSQLFGVTVDGGRWVYGDPSARLRPFDLHQDLDQQDFASWDDPILQNPDTWPPVPYLYPGDHDNCQCDFIPALQLGADLEEG